MQKRTQLERRGAKRRRALCRKAVERLRRLGLSSRKTQTGSAEKAHTTTGARFSCASGFTLVELLLVLVIIGVLAALVVPRFANRSKQARIAAAKVDVAANIATALDLYELDNGHYPTTAQGLLALTQKPVGSPEPRNWNGPYVKGGLPTDPWGNPYGYRSPCDQPNCDYELRSFGPDGLEGSDDDITNLDHENS